MTLAAEVWSGTRTLGPANVLLTLCGTETTVSPTPARTDRSGTTMRRSAAALETSWLSTTPVFPLTWPASTVTSSTQLPQLVSALQDPGTMAPAVSPSQSALQDQDKLIIP